MGRPVLTYHIGIFLDRLKKTMENFYKYVLSGQR